MANRWVDLGLTVQDEITELYVATLGRAPDKGGLAYWVNQVDTGAMTIADVAASFFAQPETQAKYPAGTTNTSFVIAVYMNALNRAPDTAGLNYWVGQLDAGTATRTDFILAVLQGAYDDPTATPPTFDSSLLTNQHIAAEYFAGVGNPAAKDYPWNGTAAEQANFLLNAHAVIVPVTADASTIAISKGLTDVFDAGGGSSTGQTFTLTTGVDTIPGLIGSAGTTSTAGDDTIVGTKAFGFITPSTLNAGDSLDGGLGTNTLKIIDTLGNGANLLAGVTVANIQNTVIQHAGGGASIVDFNGTGVSKVTSLNNTGGVVVAQNLGTGAQVIASGAGTAAGTLLQFNMKVATDAVSVGFDGGVKGTNIQATAALGTATAATLSSTGAANGTVANPDTVLFTTGAATVKTLAVNAATNLVATLAPADFVVTGAALTVSGAAASVDLGANGVFKTVDASGLTAGGVTLTTGAVLTSVIGGAGKDVITLGAAPTPSTTISLNGGDDLLMGGGGVVLPSATVVDGGANFDTISASLVNVGSAANIKNFEGLDVTGFNGPLDAALLTKSTISAATFSGTVAGTGNTAIIQNLANAATVNVNGAIVQAAIITNTLGSLTLTQTGASPTLAVAFGATPAALGLTASPGGWMSSIGDLTFTGVSTLNIAAGGNSFVVADGIVGPNGVSDTGNTLSTINITGGTAFTLSGAHTYTANSPALLADLASSLTKIDGSTATGKLTITAGATDVVGGKNVTYTGLTINGGSAADTITISAKNGVVNAGLGSDTINVNQPAAGVTSDVVTVNGGAGADTLMSTLAYGQVATATSSSTLGNYVSFADAASTDVLKFGTVTNATGALGAKANVAAAATFDQAIFLAEAGAADTVTWFQYGGNTYVESSGTTFGPGNSADNVVIKLTGLVDLSNASVVTGANGTITLA